MLGDDTAESIKALAADLRNQIVELNKLRDQNKAIGDEIKTDDNDDIVALERIIDNSGACSAIFPVYGPMKAGKSTFLAYLLREKFLPEQALPMTSIPIRIKHSSNTNGKVYLKIPQNDQWNCCLKDFRSKMISGSLNSFLNADNSVDKDKADFFSSVRPLLDRIRDEKVTFPASCEEDDVRPVLDDISRFVRLLWNTDIDFEKDFGIVIEADTVPTIELKMKVFESIGDKSSFSLMDTPGPNEAKALEALIKIGPKMMRSSSGCIFCLPWDQVAADHALSLYSYINQHMKAKKVIVIVTKMDSYRDTEESKIHLKKSIIAQFLPDMRSKLSFHMTSAHEMYELLNLSEFLNTNQAIEDGDNLINKVDVHFPDLKTRRMFRSKLSRKSREKLLKNIDEELCKNNHQEIMKSLIKDFSCTNIESNDSLQNSFDILREIKDRFEASFFKFKSVSNDDVITKRLRKVKTKNHEIAIAFDNLEDVLTSINSDILRDIADIEGPKTAENDATAVPVPVPSHQCWMNLAHMVEPQCVEHTLKELYQYFKSQITGLKSSSDQSIFSVVSAVDKLALQISEEDLDESELVLELRQVLNINSSESDQNIQVNKEMYKKAQGVVLEALCRIRPIDVSLLVDFATSSSITTANLKDKDVVVLVGNTGAGKSTLLHYLAGSTMVEKQINEWDSCIEPEIILEFMESFKIGNEFNSETKIVNAVNFACAETNQSYVLCDTPGLKDSQGCERDLANGFTVIDSIKSTKSVKLVFVITPESMGDSPRFTNLGPFIKSIKRFLENVSSTVDSCYYLFNKFTMKEFRKTCNGLENFLKNIEEGDAEVLLSSELRSDMDFLLILKDMKKAADKYISMILEKTKVSVKLRLVNLLDDQRVNFLRDFDALSPIDNPSTSFVTYAGTDSLDKLRMQCNYYTKAIVKAIKRADINMISYKLNHLKSLAHASFPDCRQTYDECVKVVFENIDFQFSELFKYANINFQTEHDNTDKIADFLTRIEQLFKFEYIRLIHCPLFKSKTFDCSNFFEYLCEEAILLPIKMTKEMILKLVHVDNNKLQKSENRKLLLRFLNWHYFDKESRKYFTKDFFDMDVGVSGPLLKVMKESSDALSSVEVEIKKTMKLLVSNLEPFLTTARFAASIDVFKKLNMLSSFTPWFEDIGDTERKAVEVFEMVISMACIDVTAELSIENILKTADKQSLVVKVSQLVNEISEVIATFVDIISSDVIRNCRRNLMEVYQQIFSICEFVCTKNSDISILQARDLFVVIQDLRNNPIISSSIEKGFYDMKLALRERVVLLNNQAMKSYNNLSTPSSVLGQILSDLKQFTCFRNLEQGIYTSELEVFVQMLSSPSKLWVDECIQDMSAKDGYDLSKLKVSYDAFLNIKRHIDITAGIVGPDHGTELIDNCIAQVVNGSSSTFKRSEQPDNVKSNMSNVFYMALAKDIQVWNHAVEVFTDSALNIMKSSQDIMGSFQLEKCLEPLSRNKLVNALDFFRLNLQLDDFVAMKHNAIKCLCQTVKEIYENINELLSNCALFSKQESSVDDIPPDVNGLKSRLNYFELLKSLTKNVKGQANAYETVELLVSTCVLSAVDKIYSFLEQINACLLSKSMSDITIHNICVLMAPLDSFLVGKPLQFTIIKDKVQEKVNQSLGEIDKNVMCHNYQKVRELLLCYSKEEVRSQLPDSVNILCNELQAEAKRAAELIAALIIDQSSLESCKQLTDLISNIKACTEPHMFADYFSEQKSESMSKDIDMLYEKLLWTVLEGLAIIPHYCKSRKFQNIVSIIDASEFLYKNLDWQIADRGKLIKDALSRSNSELATELHHICDVNGYYTVPLTRKQLHDNPPEKLFESFPNKEDFKIAKKTLLKRFETEILESLQQILQCLDTGMHESNNAVAMDVEIPNKSLRITVAGGESSSLPNDVDSTEVSTIMSTAECEEAIKDIDLFAAYLPKSAEVWSHLLIDAKRKVNDILRKNEEKEKEISSKKLDDQFKLRYNEFFWYHSRRRYSDMQTTSASVLSCLKTSVAQFVDQLDSNRLKLVLKTVPNPWKCWSAYATNIRNWEANNKWDWLGQYRNNRFGILRSNYEMRIDTKIPIEILLDFLKRIQNKIRLKTELLEDKTNYHLGDSHVLSSIADIFEFLKLENNEIIFFDEIIFSVRCLPDDCRKAVFKYMGYLSIIQDGILQLLVEIPQLLGDVTLNVLGKDEQEKIRADLQKLSGMLNILRDSRGCTELLFEMLKELPIRLKVDSKMKQLQEYEVISQKFGTMSLVFEKVVKTQYHDHCDLQSVNNADRTAFFMRVQFALSIVTEMDDRRGTVSAISCVQHINTEIEKISDKALKGNEIWLDVLRAMEDCFENRHIKEVCKEKRTMFAAQQKNHLSYLRKTCSLSESDWKRYNTQSNAEPVKRIANSLLFIKKETMTTKISSFPEELNALIDEILQGIQSRKPGGVSFLIQLASEMRSIDCTLADQIVDDHKALQGVKAAYRNRLYTKTLDATLDSLEGTNYDPQGKARSILKDLEAKFQTMWSDLIAPSLKVDISDETASEELNKIRKSCLHLAHQSNIPKAEQILSLMAYIFAYWTVESSRRIYVASVQQYKSKSTTSKAVSDYLLKPHFGQIIAIFRIFGLDKEVDATSRWHLEFSAVEIGTGEGKSVTLAVSALVLALLGYEVDIVCYSEYLSGRDKSSFDKLFKTFDADTIINYGTFKDLCEKFLNKNGDVREGVLSAICANKTAGIKAQIAYETFTQSAILAKNHKKPYVLLIDEMDVFFHDDFYMDEYTPYAKLKHADVEAFVRNVWNCRNDRKKLIPSAIEKWDEYQALRNGLFAGWEFLLQETVKMLVDDLFNYESHEYVVEKDAMDPANPNQGRIGYKDVDTISYNRRYRYKTLFAYFKESEASSTLVANQRLKENIYFVVNCGTFCYANIPKLYDCCIGVTGTLKTLSKGQLAILKHVYKVRNKTFIPSVYSDRQLVFNYGQPGDDGYFKIFNRDSFFLKLRNEINLRQTPINKKDPIRPVLVFFESAKKLRTFRESEHMRDIKISVRELTEELSTGDRAVGISRSVEEGAITLLTREFGRGIDFVVHNTSVNNVGGIHVIQTFVSLDISEEIQIKGRTARQGKQGSYSLVLCEEDLEAFGVTHVDTEFMRTSGRKLAYELVDERRKTAFNVKYENAQAHVDSILESHNLSQLFIDHLQSGQIEQVKAFIQERNNSYLSEGRVSHTLCIIDATGSMGNVIENTKNTVQAMFERTHEILQAENGNVDFQMQFAFYRDYRSKEKILQYSGWMSDYNPMREFLKTIRADCGSGEEAVEVGLWYANHIHEELVSNGEKLDQVILIGDAPPTPEHEIVERRQRVSWVGTMHETKTSVGNETRRLTENNIPVHAFYINTNNYWGNELRDSFQKIANETNQDQDSPAVCEELDVSPGRQGAEKLTSVVTKSILNSFVGILGVAKVKDMKERYDKKFGYT